MSGRYKIPLKVSKRKPGSKVGRKLTGIRRRNVFTIAFDDTEMSIFEEMAKSACMPKGELVRKALFRTKTATKLLRVSRNGLESPPKADIPQKGNVPLPEGLIA